MTITTAAGSKIYIGPVHAASVDTEAEYAALTPWVELGEVETLGEFGGQSSDVSFTALNNSLVRHLKGARDNGVLAVTVGRDPLDAGQIAAKAAEKTKFEYAFKVVAADAPDETYTDTIYYFGAIVQSARDNYGNNDNVVRTTFNIGITTEILEVSPDNS